MVDSEKIKKSLDSFEDEKYSEASDLLRGEIKKSVNDFLKSKLNLTNNPLDIKEE